MDNNSSSALDDEFTDMSTSNNASSIAKASQVSHTSTSDHASTTANVLEKSLDQQGSATDMDSSCYLPPLAKDGHKDLQVTVERERTKENNFEMTHTNLVKKASYDVINGLTPNTQLHQPKPVNLDQKVTQPYTDLTQTTSQGPANTIKNQRPVNGEGQNVTQVTLFEKTGTELNTRLYNRKMLEQHGQHLQMMHEIRIGRYRDPKMTAILVELAELLEFKNSYEHKLCSVQKLLNQSRQRLEKERNVNKTLSEQLAALKENAAVPRHQIGRTVADVENDLREVMVQKDILFAEFIKRGHDLDAELKENGKLSQIIGDERRAATEEKKALETKCAQEHQQVTALGNKIGCLRKVLAQQETFESRFLEERQKVNALGIKIGSLRKEVVSQQQTLDEERQKNGRLGHTIGELRRQLVQVQADRNRLQALGRRK